MIDSGAFVAGLIIGLAGMLIVATFVTSYNRDQEQTHLHKQLVDLGVGSYDSRTGVFTIKSCSVTNERK
jgi:hypothetical protein